MELRLARGGLFFVALHIIKPYKQQAAWKSNRRIPMLELPQAREEMRDLSDKLETIKLVVAGVREEVSS